MPQYDYNTGEWIPSFCTEIQTLGGVTLPKSMRVFDCRMPDDAMFSPEHKTPWGTIAWGSERAEIRLGMRGPNKWESTCPMSVSGYEDYRKATDGALARIAGDMRKAAADYMRKYRKAKRNPSTNGGGVHYKPIALALSNYGWCVIADRNDYGVQ